MTAQTILLTGAAGYIASLLRTEPGKEGNEPEQLGIREQLCRAPERHVLGHAIDAAKVADVRQ